MKFSTRLDVDLIAESVFDRIADFQQFERIIINRGASVQRLSPADVPGAGMAWDVSFRWRGSDRKLRIEVLRFDRPERITMIGLSPSFDLTFDLTVVALSKARSRLIVEADIRPRTMKSRLLIQTARLSKSSIDKRFAKRVREIFSDLLGG